MPSKGRQEKKKKKKNIAQEYMVSNTGLFLLLEETQVHLTGSQQLDECPQTDKKSEQVLAAATLHLAPSVTSTTVLPTCWDPRNNKKYLGSQSPRNNKYLGSQSYCTS